MKSFLFISLLLCMSSCTSARMKCSPLASITLIDSNGITEIISNEERLRLYNDVNFLTPQSYKKVLRVFKRNPDGNILACITNYHPNGELKQYLEVMNGRAHGEYGAWYENGVRKIQACVVGGIGDLYDGVEKGWLFDGCCYAYSQDGRIEAEIPYCKGKREGIAFYYHKSGAIWKEIHLSNDQMEGLYTVYFDDGSIHEQVEYKNGKKEGPSYCYWAGGTTAAQEFYEEDRLMKGTYYNLQGELISEITCGNGFKAIFDKDSVKEFHEYSEGLQEGLVKVVGKRGAIVRTYGVKNGLKHGEEIEYDLATKKPKLSIDWVQGKIQGLVKTWYLSGVQESQREMAGNKKSGVLSAWYMDGTLMLIENYDQDKLVKGEYYKHDDSFPVSTVANGEGVATLFDGSGLFLRKIKYRNGKPEN